MHFLHVSEVKKHDWREIVQWTAHGLFVFFIFFLSFEFIFLNDIKVHRSSAG